MPLDVTIRHGLGHKPDVFNSAAYAELHAPSMAVVWPGAAVFRATRLENHQFRSPGRAPYGGFDVDPMLGEADYTHFVDTCEKAVHAAGGTGLDVVLPPLCYHASQPSRLVSLSRLGYRVVRQELNQAIAVSAATFRHGARKSLAKAARAGVEVRRLTRDEEAAGYAVLAENRRKKGRTLSMAVHEMERMMRHLPSSVHAFGAFIKEEIIAAAIAVAVNPRVLYVYAWGEGRAAEPLSPVTSLAAELLRFAGGHGFSTLDLGTSSLNGIADPGLIAFKRSLGAEDGLKLWLRKALV